MEIIARTGEYKQLQYDTSAQSMKKMRASIEKEVRAKRLDIPTAAPQLQQQKPQVAEIAPVTLTP
jgi:hypothetical protein